jgi:hypothetical protein
MIIGSEYVDFSQVNDPIRTEELIYHQLSGSKINFNYSSLPLAYSINTYGIQRTQFFVDEINRKCTEQKVFVCQHILVKEINFGDNIVFTPHTIKGDPYEFIPHYNPIFNKRPETRKISDRPIDFSFIGDYNTNEIRRRISCIDIRGSVIEPIERWFFSLDNQSQSILKERYTKILLETKFPLCPPGTGPSTLRFFECLSTGGIPIIFNDLKIPKDLENLVVRADEEYFTSGDVYRLIENDELENKSNLILDTYWDNYSNENLSKSIIKYFNQ